MHTNQLPKNKSLDDYYHGIEEDSKGVQVESRRTQPPYEYRERFKAFLKGASSRQVDVNDQ